MGSFLDKPLTDKDTHSGEGNGLKWASSAMQGWRVNMEDADIAVTKVGKFDKLSFFWSVGRARWGSDVKVLRRTFVGNHH